MEQQVIEFTNSSRVHFGSFSKRETDSFIKRDPTRSPFKNSTGNESPAPGHYNPKKTGCSFLMVEDQEGFNNSVVRLSPKRLGHTRE